MNTTLRFARFFAILCLAARAGAQTIPAGLRERRRLGLVLLGNGPERLRLRHGDHPRPDRKKRENGSSGAPPGGPRRRRGPERRRGKGDERLSARNELDADARADRRRPGQQPVFFRLRLFRALDAERGTNRDRSRPLLRPLRFGRGRGRHLHPAPGAILRSPRGASPRPRETASSTTRRSSRRPARAPSGFRSPGATRVTTARRRPSPARGSTTMDGGIEAAPRASTGRFPPVSGRAFRSSARSPGAKFRRTREPRRRAVSPTSRRPCGRSRCGPKCPRAIR